MLASIEAPHSTRIDYNDTRGIRTMVEQRILRTSEKIEKVNEVY